MRRLLTASLTLLALAVTNVPSTASPISVGHPLEISFTDQGFLPSPGSGGNQGLFSLFFSKTDPFDVGEVIRYEMFHDENFSEPISFGAIGFYIDYVNDTPDANQIGVSVLGAWQDLSGSFRLTMLQGSVDLDKSFVWIFKDGTKYSRWVHESGEDDVGNSVPEPSTLALIGMALLSLFGFGMMRRRSDA